MNTRTLRTAAAALAAVAALTLTACGGGGGSDSKDKDSTKNDKADAQTADGADGGDDAGEEGEDSAGKGAAKGDACTPADVKIETRKVTSPDRHLLLVATAKKACTAYGFPFLRFDQDQASAASVDQSKPAKPVKLAPGKSAYAGVRTSSADGSGGTGRDAKQLNVALQSEGGDQVEGGETQAALPATPLHVDDSSQTTYWQDSEAAALKW
ncbi:DUF4232 domain-containing protein [Streptomyces orinoci]|uniref:DUF4232 domain-containing protein n=1 Tax=Streptomyces orinoci TaxID=67339 RepID=A0ABV3K1S1_STRON|nr:DUF4232 domain-containing protein [Streptomyces orinoci]